jgi:hypothetical protein
MEQWKQFHTSSKYDWYISNHGNIKRINNGIINRGKVKQITLFATGGRPESQYLAISINDAADKYVHRIVATAFIPNPDNKETVNHKDGNKQNNHVDNLEWHSYTENMMHAHRTGLHPVKHRRLTWAQAEEVRSIWAEGDHLVTELAKLFGVHDNSIKQIILGLTYKEKADDFNTDQIIK